MRFLKVFFGLAVALTVLTGCGGGSTSTTATSSAAPTSSSSPTSASSGSTGSSTPSPAPSPTPSPAPSPAPSPPPSTGSATLSWTAPTTNSDGSALTDLAGYHIHYGTNASSLSSEVNVSNPSTLMYQVTSLGSGTWYFAVTSYTTSGLESPLSSVVSKTIS